MTSKQALRVIEREIDKADISLAEGSDLVEALNVLWNFALTGKEGS